MWRLKTSSHVDGARYVVVVLCMAPGVPMDMGAHARVYPIMCVPIHVCTHSLPQVPAVDQATGQSEGSGSGTLRALQQLRKGETLGEGWQVEALKKEVFFGVNMVPLSGGGLVRVGDVLTVQEHRTSWK